MRSVLFASQNTNKKPLPTKKLKGGLLSAWGTVLLHLVGGSALVISQLMPHATPPQSNISLQEVPIVALESEPKANSPKDVQDLLGQLKELEEEIPSLPLLHKNALSLEEKSTLKQIEKQLQKKLNPNKWAELQPIIEKIGWSLFSIAMLTASYSWAGASFNRKQPSLLLCNISLGLGVSPLFTISTIDPATLIGWSFVFTGLGYSGFANIIEEDTNKDPEFKAKTHDLNFLLHGSTYTGLIKSGEERQAFLKELKTMGTFIINDQKEMLKAVKEVIPEVKRNKTALSQYFKNRSEQVLQTLYLKEKSTEPETGKQESNEKPIIEKQLLKATKEQTQVTGLLYYLGGGLMPFFPLTGAIITGIGSLSGNILTLSIGTQRKDALGKALEYGSLIKTPIDFLQNIPLFIGANRIVKALTVDLMGVQLNKEGGRLIEADENENKANDKKSKDT